MRKSDTRCESKQECSSSKADELKVEFSAEWLRIWRYERGMRNKEFSGWTDLLSQMPLSALLCEYIVASIMGIYMYKGGKEC